MPSELVYEYMRIDHLPHIWCAGCGNGTLMHDIVVALDDLIRDKESGITRENVVIVSGIGCSARAAGYLDFSSIHTTHGRAIAFATGIKIANPNLHVIVVTGDGDCSAIGGNHLIHAARRNLDLTVVVFNNTTYGMTGGQYSPTTPQFDTAATAPYGVIDRPFNIAELAAGAGASFTASGDVFHTKETIRQIRNGILHHGFSLIECHSICPTYYGRKNRKGSAVDMLKYQKEHGLIRSAYDRLPADKKKDYYPVGSLTENGYPEFTDLYSYIIKSAQSQGPLDRSPRRDVVMPGTGTHLTKDRYEMRLAGSGGQGVILASVILAEAAVIEGKNAIQSQSYGPEARGGTCRAEAILGEKPLGYSKVSRPHFLLALTQASLDKYSGNLADDAFVLIDSSLTAPEGLTARTVSLPILKTARDVVGKSMTANIVALGAINGLLRLFPEEVLQEAVKRHIPGGTEELNLRALKEGEALAAQAVQA
ncbi:MAG: 2-oxoacid:acceptor oxidoreductase family protein [Lachnospiraceae bacterium]|nr:2-oxoacid:acceptor oxidoreductase family protein [Lachnospiraceae bacterium]